MPQTTDGIRCPSYFAGKFYMYLPNLCNARCFFCHVQPQFARSARLTSACLFGAAEVFQNAREHGLTEVKFTGGEPLLFSNARALFEAAISAHLEYSVLTNGLLLEDWFEFFCEHPPAQVMVSVHDYCATGNSDVFGVDRSDTRKLLHLLGALAAEGVRTTVTSVVTRRATAGLVKLQQALSGAIDRKIVRATDVPFEESVSPGDFDELCNDMMLAMEKGRATRVSDTSYSGCQLVERGFLSIVLPSFATTPCCLALSEASLSLDPRDSAGFGTLLAQHSAATTRSRYVSTAPCGTDSAHCPLALRRWGMSDSGADERARGYATT